MIGSVDPGRGIQARQQIRQPAEVVVAEMSPATAHDHRRIVGGDIGPLEWEPGELPRSRPGSTLGPRPTSGGNRVAETYAHAEDGRDGSHERFVPHRSLAVQSTAHANADAERFVRSI